MESKTGGHRPRPRVALLGEFAANDLARFETMFPTVWKGTGIWTLAEQVDSREIDLLIIAPGVDHTSNWAQDAHIICSSNDLGHSLPGPIDGIYIKTVGKAQTEAFSLPDVPLALSQLRDAEYGNLTSVRGWHIVGIAMKDSIHGTSRSRAAKALGKGAIVTELCTGSPLAVMFVRGKPPHGLAYLPNVHNNLASWVEVILHQWAQIDKEAFPAFGDWTNSPEWLVPQELELLSQMDSLREQKQSFILDADRKIQQLSSQLSRARITANSGLRRLITAQGSDLVDEVSRTLRSIGFQVVEMDEALGDGVSRREDLRISCPNSRSPRWEAIAEVRGYGRRSGTTSDLMRLSRFSSLYAQETGHHPDKLLYIVNGQIELLPPYRQEPLAAAKEDLREFVDSNGLVIWTLDLFRAISHTAPKDYAHIMNSIVDSTGRWSPALKDM